MSSAIKALRTAILSISLFGVLAACGQPAPPVGDLVIGFTAANPTAISRPGEYVHLALDLPMETLARLEGKTPLVFRVAKGKSEEVPSQMLGLNPDGQAASPTPHVSLVFRDDFSPRESKSYELRFEQASSIAPGAIQVDDLATTGMGDRLLVRNGVYSFAIGHEPERLDYGWGGALMKDLYIRLDGEGQGAKLMPLSHIYFNTPEHRRVWLQDEKCEPLLVISPGLPPDITIRPGPLLTSITLGYRGQAQQACPPFEEGLEPPRPTELYRAEVVLTFYRDLPRVDTRTEVTLTQGFYNHNGLAMGGVETQLARPRVLFGVPEHTVLQGTLWADTPQITDRTEFMQLEGGRFVFRRASTRDAGAPFEVLSQSETFKDYYVVEGLNGRGSLVYFPDFTRLAYQNTRDEGLEIVPVNMIGAGPSVPLMVPNPIILSQTHLGNIGEVWAPIAPGTYTYRMTGLLDVAFDPRVGQAYDAAVERLAIPVSIALTGGGLVAEVSPATATVPAPASSTPPPTATSTPTPGPASCAPSNLSIQPPPLPEGSLLPLLANEFSHFEGDGALVLENPRTDEYSISMTEFFTIPGTFTLAVRFEGPPDIEPLFLDGNPRSPDWSEREVLYLGDVAMRLFDGRPRSGEGSEFDWYPYPQENGETVLTFRFYEPCGKRFAVLGSMGNALYDLDLEQPGEHTEFANGIFPDSVVSFVLNVPGGSWIKVKELMVAYD